ncbi:MAG: adenosylmethionine decarboxylase [Nitrospinota bacterium]
MESQLGTHVFGRLTGCPKEFLETAEAVRNILFATVQEAGFKTVGDSFHQFEPVGATGIILLSESHISIHTWPETTTALVDIFTCGTEGNAEVGFDILCSHLQPTKIDKKVLQR